MAPRPVHGPIFSTHQSVTVYNRHPIVPEEPLALDRWAIDLHQKRQARYGPFRGVERHVGKLCHMQYVGKKDSS